MQALIELPRWREIKVLGGPEKALFRPVCCLPLLVQVIVAAMRNEKAGCFFIAHPPELDWAWFKDRLRFWLGPEVLGRFFIIENDENRTLAAIFEKRYVCLPWNHVAGIQVDSDESAACAEHELVCHSG